MKKVCFLFLVFLIGAKPIFAAIVINEFQIEPSQIVEILNTASNSADISHFYIDDNGGTTFFTIPDNSIIPPLSCLIFSGEFNLNKSTTDTIRLFDSIATPTSQSAHLIDSFSYKASSGSGVVYMRLPDGQNNWDTGEASFGYFNGIHVSCLVPPTPTTIPITPFSTPTSSPPPFDEQNIYISEFMPAPSVGNEWVELFNKSDAIVSLVHWYIDDTEKSGGSPYQFSVVIQPKGYAIIDLSRSLLNNAGDQVRLLNANSEEIDNQSFSYSLPDYSWGKEATEENFCIQKPTKATINNECFSVPEPTIIIERKKENKLLDITDTVSPKKAEIRKNIGIIALNEKKTTRYAFPQETTMQQYTEWISYGAVTCPLLTISYIYIHMQRRKRLAKQRRNGI